MELKEGMYIRIKDKNNNQFIRKIIKLPEDTRYGSIVVDKDIHYARWVSKKKVIKASSNIIELIQVGDNVNGYMVLEVTEQYIKLNNPKLNHDVIEYERILKNKYSNMAIRDVVTKEQFESQKYYVESE